jgi:hypothetical protein
MTGIVERSRPKVVVAPGEDKEGKDEQWKKIDGGAAEIYSSRTNRRNKNIQGDVSTPRVSMPTVGILKRPDGARGDRERRGRHTEPRKMEWRGESRRRVKGGEDRAVHQTALAVTRGN